MVKFKTYKEWYDYWKYWPTIKLQKEEGEMLRLYCVYGEKYKLSSVFAQNSWKALQAVLNTRTNKKEWWELEQEE